MKKKISSTIAIVLVLQLILATMPVSAYAVSTDYSPNPKTAYAKEFIKLCEGQQWLITEVERILNSEQKTIDTISSSADLSVITSIGLKDKKICGKIPRAIGQLTALKNLFLSGNQLSGTIPAELYTLPGLSNIDISNNYFCGTIPSEFGTMPSVKILMLGGNRFTGSIPVTILANTNIKVLDVSGNKLSGAIPAALNHMTGLTYLAVSDNCWQGSIPDLSALRNLKTLSMWGCNLKGQIPESIYTLSQLQILDLYNNKLEGEISKNIGNLTSLQLFSLGNNNLGGTIPAEMDNLTNLMEIDLSNNLLRGFVSEKIAAVSSVHFENNYLTGTVLKTIKNNQGNFCDGASTEQYRLYACSLVSISKSRTTDIYPLLYRKLILHCTLSKPALPADCYDAVIINDSGNKVSLTCDSKGIFVKANADIQKKDNIAIEVMIKGNTGSGYSKVTIQLTTESGHNGGCNDNDNHDNHDYNGGGSSSGGSSGGGSGAGGGGGSSSGGSSGGGGGGGSSSGGSISNPDWGNGEVPQTHHHHHKYIDGYPGGRFMPGHHVTREEIAKMIIMALEKVLDTSADGMPYPDVENNRWSALYIKKMQELSLLQGYQNGSFGPDKPMSRAELIACLVRASEIDGVMAPEAKLDFSDVGSNEWYTQYIAKAVALGITNGYGNGTFGPGKTVTRAEAVTMINRMMGRNPEDSEYLKEAANPFTDIDSANWAYLHVLEASVGYEE